MRILKGIREMVLNLTLSDGAVRTGGFLMFLGKRVEGMTQGEIARLRGIAESSLRRHMKELARSKMAVPLNTKGRVQNSMLWQPRKRVGDPEIQRVLAENRVDVALAGWLASCARQGCDPYGCCDGECYDKIVGEEVSYGAFLCGSALCFRLLHLAGQREPLLVGEHLERA